jgi:hypothetical protein
MPWVIFIDAEAKRPPIPEGIVTLASLPKSTT